MAHKIFFAIFLSLVATAAVANSPADPREECLVDGWVNLRLNGTLRSGWLSGRLGDKSYVNWNVFNGRVNAWIDRAHVSLDFDEIGSQLYLTGWVGRNYVRWRAWNGQISEYVRCLPEN